MECIVAASKKTESPPKVKVPKAAKVKAPPKPKDISPRFGIGEWYGNRLIELSGAERQYYGAEQAKKKSDRDAQPCPFQSTKEAAKCTKPGGVCSLQLYAYKLHPETGRAAAEVVEGVQGALRATCPYRFHEGLKVFRWVGEKLLGDADPKLVGEVGFLEAGATTDNEGGDDVGRFDMILVSNKPVQGAPMDWCALEIQAVYFSGNAMTGEFAAYSDPKVDWVVFPAGRRRPDYRSSGPKRLMPQLQIKIPTLRRWGKKMAVVVDKAFFDSIGEMDHVADISNADIAWFVVRFEEDPGAKRSRIVLDGVRYTTLERSVEGLTGGKPVPKHEFEKRIAGALKAAPTLKQADLAGLLIPEELPDEP
jgi:hypothetical protein